MLPTTMVATKLLKPYERNPRTITKDQFAKLCDTLQKHKDYFEMRPILAYKDEDGTLIVYAGNQRLRAAKKLGWKEVPCIVDEEATAETIKQRTVLDNIHHGEHDYDILGADYDLTDLLELGMTEKELGLMHDALDEETKPKGKKAKACPHCGEELFHTLTIRKEKLSVGRFIIFNITLKLCPTQRSTTYCMGAHSTHKL